MLVFTQPSQAVDNPLQRLWAVDAADNWTQLIAKEAAVIFCVLDPNSYASWPKLNSSKISSLTLCPAGGTTPLDRRFDWSRGTHSTYSTSTAGETGSAARRKTQVLNGLILDHRSCAVGHLTKP